MTLTSIQPVISSEYVQRIARHALATSETLTIKSAQQITGGLSRTSKMPCCSYGLPTAACKTGRKLSCVPGSVCSNCYACNGSYVMYREVIPAQNRRLASLGNPLWAAAMVKLITSDQWLPRDGKKPRVTEKLFRWHDSGDLQSLQHLAHIVAIAIALPDYKFWLPTREYTLIREWLRTMGAFPRNLIVRCSAAMVDGRAPLAITGHASGVHTPDAQHIAETKSAGYRVCPAYQQNGACGDCRACFNTRIKVVSYPLH